MSPRVLLPISSSTQRNCSGADSASLLNPQPSQHPVTRNACAFGLKKESQNVNAFCRLGWGLPWPIRVRIAELLMAAGFDASQDGAPIPEQKQLVYVLRHHLWPLLGLPVALHDVLNAWAYLRQFALTGEPHPAAF